MALIHMTPDSYIVSQWSGGTTTQVAIAPEGAVYADRDFLWRISSASVDLDESDFTALPDYHRWISTLKGGMTLSHEGGEKIVLAPYEVHQFDGGVDTHSWGRCTDFNLMLRKGKCRGVVRSIKLAAGESAVVNFESTPSEQFPNADLMIFCGEGKATAALNGESVALTDLHAALVKNAVGVSVTVTAQEVSCFMIAEVQI